MTMTKTLKIYIEQHPNKDFRTAHVSLPLCGLAWSEYDAKGKPEKIKVLEGTLRRRQELGDSNGGIRNNKQISIGRNRAFSWDEAIAAAVDVLERYFKLTATVEVQEREAWMDKDYSKSDDY